MVSITVRDLKRAEGRGGGRAYNHLIALIENVAAGGHFPPATTANQIKFEDALRRLITNRTRLGYELGARRVLHKLRTLFDGLPARLVLRRTFLLGRLYTARKVPAPLDVRDGS